MLAKALAEARGKKAVGFLNKANVSLEKQAYC